MKSKVLSALIAIAYLIPAGYQGGPEVFFKLAAFLVLPLVCIWFSEEMGSFTGVIGGHSVNAPTPGCLVAFGGWTLLLLPVVLALISYCRGG